jgi:hypothetical protein
MDLSGYSISSLSYRPNFLFFKGRGRMIAQGEGRALGRSDQAVIHGNVPCTSDLKAWCDSGIERQLTEDRPQSKSAVQTF